MHSSRKGRFLFEQFVRLMKRKYVAQLFCEYSYLVKLGKVSRLVAFVRVFRWFFALGQHTKELFRRELQGNGCVIFQGAASNDVFERLNPTSAETQERAMEARATILYWRSDSFQKPFIGWSSWDSR